jgi:hypothetical protein
MSDSPYMRRARAWLPALLPVLLLVLLYARTLDYPFVNYDDDTHIRRNTAVTSPERLSVADQLYPRHLGYPMPLTMLSYRLDVARTDGAKGSLRRDQARAFHQTNLLLACLLALCGFAVARRLLGSSVAAAVVVGAWFLHPLTVEPIAWVTGRKDLLMATFALAALWAALAHLERPSLARLLGVALASVAAMLAKPTGIFIVPLLFYLGLCSKQARELAPGPRRGLLIVGTLLALAAAALVVVAWHGHVATGGSERAASWAALAHRVLGALGVSARLIAFPVGLGPRYVFVGDLPGAGYLALALLPLGLAGWTLWRAGRRAGPAAIAVVLAALSFAPSSNVMPFTRFVADSYLLLPTFGLLLALGVVLQPWLRQGRQRALVALTLGLTLAAAASALTWVQIEQWSSSTRLWRPMAARYPGSPQVCRMLAHAHTSERDFQRAISIGQRCIKRFGPALFAKNLAISYLLAGQRERALRYFRIAARAHPNDPVPRKYLRLLGAPGR